MIGKEVEVDKSNCKVENDPYCTFLQPVISFIKIIVELTEIGEFFDNFDYPMFYSS